MENNFEANIVLVKFYGNLFNEILRKSKYQRFSISFSPVTTTEFELKPEVKLEETEFLDTSSFWDTKSI